MSAYAAVSDSGGTSINLSQLPEEDQDIVKGILGNRVLGIKTEVVYIFFDLDEYKNFDCSVPTIHDGKTSFKFTLGNRVASIPPHEASKGGSDVKIERKGKDIVIGDRIKLEKNRIQNLVNPSDPTHNGANRGFNSPPRQKVAGRNAYEIRQDLIENAIEVIKLSSSPKNSDPCSIADEVLEVAARLYEFVEHK
jgi:hypothetical protein